MIQGGSENSEFTFNRFLRLSKHRRHFLFAFRIVAMGVSRVSLRQTANTLSFIAGQWEQGIAVILIRFARQPSAVSGSSFVSKHCAALPGEGRDSQPRETRSFGNFKKLEVNLTRVERRSQEIHGGDAKFSFPRRF